MKKVIANTVCIAVDQGNYNVKACGPAGAIEPFPTGVNHHGTVPPPMRPGSIRLNDQHYSITTDRMQARRNKTADDDYYLLTLAAIGRTIAATFPGGTAYECDVALALGLPVEHLSLKVDGVLLRERYRTFFGNKGERVAFMVDGIRFDIRVTQVWVFAQTISAAISDAGIYNAMLQSSRAYIIDIGGGTTNVISIINKKPQNPGITLEEMGVLELFKTAHRTVLEDCGRSVDDFMLDVLLRGDKECAPDMQNALERARESFVRRLLLELESRKVDFFLGYICLVGGGGVLLHDTLKKAIAEKGNGEFAAISDVSANAKGYYAQAMARMSTLGIVPAYPAPDVANAAT